jgi:hypothetical protein
MLALISDRIKLSFLRAQKLISRPNLRISCKSGGGWQHLPPFGVLLGRGVKTLAHLKAGNQSVTS